MKKYSGTKLILLSGLFIVMTFNVFLICIYVSNVNLTEKNRVNSMVRENNIFRILSKSALIDIEPLRNNLIDLINIDSLSSPTILYIYDYTDCNKCIFTDIAVLKECSFFKKRNILVIPNIDDTRDNRIKVDSDLRNIDYITISPVHLQLPLLNDKKTRLFILYRDGMFFYPFVPDSSYPEITEKYLEFTYNIDCVFDD